MKKLTPLLLLEHATLTGDLEISTYLLFLSIASESEIALENFPFSIYQQTLLQQFQDLGSEWSYQDNILKIKTPLYPKPLSKPINPNNELEFVLFLTWFSVSKSLNTIKTTPFCDFNPTSFDFLKEFLHYTVKETSANKNLYIAQKFEISPSQILNLKPHFLTKTCLLFAHVLMKKPLQLSNGHWGGNQLETLLDHFRLPLCYKKQEEDMFSQRNELEKRIFHIQKKNQKNQKGSSITLSQNFQFPKKPFIIIPNDLNLACFYSLIAAITSKGKVTLSNVCFNNHRSFFFSALKRMGANITIKKRIKNNDTVADIQVKHSKLIGRKFALESVQKMSKQIPFLILSGIFAEGKTIIRNIDFLRNNNMDLLHSMVTSFKGMLLEIGEIEDGLVIKGKKELQKFIFPPSNNLAIEMTYWIINLMNQEELFSHNYQYIINHYPQLALEKVVEKISKNTLTTTITK